MHVHPVRVPLEKRSNDTSPNNKAVLRSQAVAFSLPYMLYVYAPLVFSRPRLLGEELKKLEPKTEVRHLPVQTHERVLAWKAVGFRR